VREAAHRWRQKDREPVGFVHVGEWKPQPSADELRIPLIFGSMTDEGVAQGDPGSRDVGEVVADCLERQGIRYAWDGAPGRLVILADRTLSGIPLPSGHHAVELDDGLRALLSRGYPDRAFESVADNPVRLLNVTELRRLNVPAPHLLGPRRCPGVGDRVKLGFLVRDALDPEALRELGEQARRLQIEAMWVEVTNVRGRHPNSFYRGELLDEPLFLDPARVRVGSPVEFTADHVYPAETESRSRARR
jgi:hypothetical protein